MPEAWLRGPVEDVCATLQPVVHSLDDALEEITHAVGPLAEDDWWTTSHGAAPIGFHLRHIAGSINRLLTYAQGEQLSETQLSNARTESFPGTNAPEPEELLHSVATAMENVRSFVRKTGEEDLHDRREVGRAKLPSSVLGILFHIAEHTRRHAGQIVTTSRILLAMRSSSAT